VFRVGAIKAVIAVAPADDETSRFQFGQFILNRLERKIAQPSELANVQFGSGIGEERRRISARTLGNKPCKSVCRIAHHSFDRFKRSRLKGHIGGQSDLCISVSSKIDELEVRSQVPVGERPGGFQVEVFCIL
jgi:hypothetical protein